jgi:uncharacterized protein YbjT (DUF2867 family)
MSAPVFVTGGTGYVGRPLIAALIARGHVVHALVRPGSEAKLPFGAVAATGDALEESTFASAIPPGATLVHLVGTPHPNPAKAAEFNAWTFARFGRQSQPPSGPGSGILCTSASRTLRR